MAGKGEYLQSRLIPHISVHPQNQTSILSSYRISKKGSETPRKSRRLIDESRAEDFHAPLFNILSQTQTHKSTGKEKFRSVKSKMKKTKTKRQRKEGRRGKEKKFKHHLNLSLILLTN